MELRFGVGKKGREWIGYRYMRWVLGVNGRTPGYLVREEMQRDKIRTRAGKRA